MTKAAVAVGWRQLGGGWTCEFRVFTKLSSYLACGLETTDWAEEVAQWHSIDLACLRPYARSPAPEEKKKKSQIGQVCLTAGIQGWEGTKRKGQNQE
jgi:hypothetical protein